MEARFRFVDRFGFPLSIIDCFYRAVKSVAISVAIVVQFEKIFRRVESKQPGGVRDDRHLFRHFERCEKFFPLSSSRFSSKQIMIFPMLARKALFAAAILGILPMLIGAAEPAQAGCVIEAPGFLAAEIRVGVELDGLAPSPGGAYGSALYAASNATVLRIDPVSGKFHKFAVKLAAGGSRPSGLAFDQGTFATGLLYVAQNAGSVVTVSPSGNVKSFSAAGTLFSSNDLAFATPGSAFGNHLFVSNGTFGPGNLSKINAEGANSFFTPTKIFARARNGLTFTPPVAAYDDG